MQWSLMDPSESFLSRSEISRKANQVNPAPESRLLRDPVEMRPHGAGAYKELLSNLSVSEPLCDEVDYFPLSPRQSVDAFTYGLARFGDVRIIDRDKDKDVLATLDPVATLQRMLPHSTPIDDGAVAAAKIEQEPPSVSELQFRMQTRHLGVIENDDVIGRVPPDGGRGMQQLEARAVR
jgi:hypothetical protein